MTLKTNWRRREPPPKGESMKQIGLKMNDQELKLLVRVHKKIEKKLGYKISRKQVFMILINQIDSLVKN
jgi:hypothetical protein